MGGGATGSLGGMIPPGRWGVRGSRVLPRNIYDKIDLGKVHFQAIYFTDVFQIFHPVT